MASLPLSNVINTSLSLVSTGLNAFNTSNVCLFSTETPGSTFPGAGFQTYQDAPDVATDFGTGSQTYAMALQIFSQQPNILANGGYLCIATYTTSETTAAAITRTLGLVSYFAVMSTQIETQANMLAAASVAQAAGLMAFFVQTTQASIAAGGSLDLLRSGTFTQSRGLYYGGTTTQALGYMAGYAGRALSTNFNGSNTAQTMHLKPIAGTIPDPTMTQTLLGLAQAAGADCYVSIQGVPCTFCSGANTFFDQIYGQDWFVSSINTAGFNYLAQAATKVPQTEGGMDGLKGAFRAVCEQAVTNQFCAPGSWTSPNTFGVQADLIANIAQRGYYIYSNPIATQLQTARAARQAPVVQIALKLAGAIHSASIIVNVNQ